MRILVLTPLFPPDVSVPAAYAKELVSRLGAHHHVTCLHYGQLPEKAGAATLVSVRKDVSVLIRLLGYIRAVARYRDADAVIIMNGPSVELPHLLLVPLVPRPRIYIENDVDARTRASVFGTVLHRLVRRSVTHVIQPREELLVRPIIHPLEPNSETMRAMYNTTWATHAEEITTICQK